jgi:hypothetical protein
MLTKEIARLRDARPLEVSTSEYPSQSCEHP